MYVDAHLDLAFNVVAKGRDLSATVEAVRRRERRRDQAILVTLPELRAAGVGLALGTLFTLPRDFIRPPGAPALTTGRRDFTYQTPEQACRWAVIQLDIYRHWEERGLIRIIRSQPDLRHHLATWRAGEAPLGVVLLMEGGDPILTPDHLGWWVERGVRAVGPAWQRTRYSGGTHAPGPLTPEGRELVLAMTEHEVILDTSHMAEESFWDAVALEPRHLMASHSNARAITPTDRHLTDEMIRAIGHRKGVIGLVLGNEFVKPGVTRTSPKHSVTLADVRRQAEHIAGLVGWHSVGIGSDFDGGFGLQETPLEITRGADFHRLGEVAPPEERAGVLGENWIRFLERALPG